MQTITYKDGRVRVIDYVRVWIPTVWEHSRKFRKAWRAC